MGTCILCGEIVAVDSSAAWKITPVTHQVLEFEPMHWIHSGCIDRARAASMRPLRSVG